MTTRSALRAVLALVLVAAASAPCLAGAAKHLNRATDWPQVDLSAYDTVFVEDCRMKDPMADERKIRNLVDTAHERLANYTAYALDRELYPTVERRSPKPGEEGVVVRIDLDQYKPGSQAARFWMAGTGSAHLDITVHIVDAASGETLQSFSEKRNFAWGGIYGGSRGITTMEQKAGLEIAAYLSLAKGLDEQAVIANMKELQPVGGPEDTPHGTIIIMRPQGMVGAAARFRLGVNDLDVGESKRNTYHVIYVKPGQHKVWHGSDKKKKGPTVDVAAGQTYYFQAMGMKQIPNEKAIKKLPQCRLAWEIDMTGE